MNDSETFLIIGVALMVIGVIGFISTLIPQSGFNWTYLLLGIGLSVLLSLFIPGAWLLCGVFVFTARR